MGYAEWRAGQEELPTFQRSSLPGLLGGMAKGAGAGSMFGPWGTLIGSVVGAGAGLVGAGIKGAQEAKLAKQALEEKRREEEEAKKERMIDRRSQAREQDMSGMELLASMRDRAMRDYRNQVYRDGVVKLLQGAA